VRASLTELGLRITIQTRNTNGSEMIPSTIEGMFKLKCKFKEDYVSTEYAYITISDIDNKGQRQYLVNW
jgi:hypothetical protein